MKRSTLINIVLFSVSAVALESTKPLFLETFDGPDLPFTLNYEATPGLTWTIDASSRLFADKTTSDGQLASAISFQGFSLPPGGLSYSVDLGKPENSNTGGYNVGLIFGDYVALFHPGLGPAQGSDGGAFRLEKAGSIVINNQEMGFTPAQGVLHHIEVLLTVQDDGLLIDITITGPGEDGQIHTYTRSFLDPEPGLNNGNVGVRTQGHPGIMGDAFFDNLRVCENLSPCGFDSDCDGDVDLDDFAVFQAAFTGP